MGSYSSTTGYITLYAGGGWEDVTFPAISIASGEEFYRFKVSRSNTLAGIEIQNSAGNQTLSFDTWYTNYAYINSTLSAAKIKTRNTAGQTRTTTFTLTVETTVSAHSITVNAGSGGTASASTSSASSGTTITITCSPSTGYSANTPTATGITFTSAGANKWTFTMPNSDVTVSCTFSKVNYTVGKTEGTGGTGSLSKTTANYGDTITVTASPSTGYSANTPTASGITFTSAGTNKWTFTMPASNVTVAFTFTQINYSVGVSSNPAAGGTLNTNKATAHYGDTVTLTRTAAAGYQFSSWTLTPSNLSINGSLQFTMPAQNVSIVANWTKISYNVTTSVSSGSGTLSSNKSTAQVGDTVTITANPSAGYSAGTPSATGITFTNAGTNKWTFTMPAAAVAVSISFSKITYTISKVVSPSGAGTVTVAATGQVGDQISVSQTPATGYYFNGWTFNPAGPSVSGGKFTMPANNVTVTANYLKRSTATLSVSSMTDGNVVTLTIVPDKTTYSHKYKLSFGTNMETALTNVEAGTTSVQITIPSGANNSWARQIPNATQKTGGTLVVETYSGSTKIGEYTITGLTYNVPSTANPTIGTITTSIVRTVGGTTYANVGNVYVQSKCAVRTQASASGALGSTISKIELSMSGYTAAAYKSTVNSGSIDFTSGLLTVSGSCTITLKATDSRGRTVTSTTTITVSAYNRPSGTLTVRRVNNGGTVDPLGTYATYELTKSYTQVGNNSLAWSLTSQGSTANSPAASGNILPSSRQSFSQTQEYTIRLTLTDSFETVHIDVTLPTAQFMIYVNANGDRIAFMKATNESLDKNGKNGTIEFSANHQMYIGTEKAESYFTPATTKSWQYNRVHWHIPQDGNTVGFTFNINSANYIWGSFHIHTRFGFHTLIFATDGSANIQVRTHAIDAFNSETLTATVSGRTVTVTSSVNWNYFDVDGLSSQATSAFSFTRILQS